MKNFFFSIILLQLSLIYGQDMMFSYVGKYESNEKLMHLADSLKKPLLFTEDKVYIIGSDCLTRLFDGSLTDRVQDSKSNYRYKDGDIDERKRGGGIVERNKKNKKNDRMKGGDIDDREEDGDVNDRNKDVRFEKRNSNGFISDGPRCSYTKRGKILIYTRQDINSKTAKIFYNNKFFSNQFFKIIKL